jgi:hypothetical protein
MKKVEQSHSREIQFTHMRILKIKYRSFDDSMFGFADGNSLSDRANERLTVIIVDDKNSEHAITVNI